MFQAWVMFILGLAFGSFVNAAVWRLHKQLEADPQEAGSKNQTGQDKQKFSIIYGRSACPKCGHTLGWYELIPVLSWLIQRGKCRSCRRPISYQYPLVELATGGLFTVSFMALPTAGWIAALDLGFWLAFVVGLMLLAVYDLRFQLLPNRVLLPLLALAGFWVGLQALIQQDISLVVPKLVAAGLAGGFFYTLFAVSGGKWMGGGDVKLAFLLGLLLGPANTLVGLLIAFNSAAVISLGLMALGKANRKSRIPFGPFLIAGGMVAMLYGETMINWYFQLVGI